ncbi:MAG: ATP-binding protein [Rhodospirillaceae bacterium]
MIEQGKPVPNPSAPEASPQARLAARNAAETEASGPEEPINWRDRPDPGKAATQGSGKTASDPPLASGLGTRPPPLTWGRAFTFAIAATIPSAIVLTGLAVTGLIDSGYVFPALAAIWLMTGLILRLLVGDLLKAFSYAHELAIHGKARKPDIRYSSLAEWGRDAVDLLDRSHRHRQAELTRDLDAALSTLDSCPDPILLLDRRAVITSANGAARDLFARTLEGHEITAILRDPAVIDGLEKVMERRERTSLQTRMVAGGGRDLELRAAPLPPNARDGAELIMSLHDITALKKLEKMRADFVANASHELRTPLSSLIGFTETLAGPARDDPEARDRFLGIMLDQARRMQRLIEDLLSLSRIEIEEHSTPRGIADLATVLRAVADGLELRAEEKSMQVVLDLTEDLPTIPGDPDQLAQIFQNLVDNAIKYGREGTDVVVRVRRVAKGPTEIPARWRKNCLQVAVEDHGDGIAKDHLGRLTERFYRVDKARSRAMGGTGLGLAIVKHVVARHRGALEIESELGNGSVFTVYLPVRGGS